MTRFRKRVMAMAMSFLMIISCAMTGVCGAIEAVAAATSNEAAEPVWGDANDNGTPAETADVVLIMQSISNPDKYGLGQKDGLTTRGAKNADVYCNGDGITAMDALSIQKYQLGIIS